MSNEQTSPVVITVSQQKGGAGKSTLTKNLTTHFALNKGKKILNIDGDYSGFLSLLYGVFDQEKSIGELFKYNNDMKNLPQLKFHKVHENIDLIAFDSNLNEKIKLLNGTEGQSHILIKWMMQYKSILSYYDYIFIDTHNDFELFTKNAVSVSDIVLAPLDPAENKGFVSTRMVYEFEKFKNQLVEPITGKSYVKANLYTIGNKIMHNVADHQKFLDNLKQMDDYLTWIPHKALYVQASKEITTIEDMIGSQKKRHEYFYEQYKEAMHKIENVIYNNEKGENKNE